MAAKLIRIIAVAVAASATFAAASKLGSIVNSFPARIRIGAIKTMPTGMAYAGGYIWMMYHTGYVAKRAFPSGSVIATYDVYPHVAAYSGLAYDGQYFWTTYRYRETYSTFLKLNPATMSVVASYPLRDFLLGCSDFTYDGRHFWISAAYGTSEKFTTYRITSAGSIVSSHKSVSLYVAGICYGAALPDGARIFESDITVYPPMFYAYKTPGHVYDYRFVPRHTAARYAGCWDGEYLWTFANHDPGGNEYCYQIVAWEPDYAVAPASLGKVKALFH